MIKYILRVIDRARGKVVLYCIHEDGSELSTTILRSYLHISINPVPKFRILFKCECLPILCRATHTSDSPSMIDSAFYTTQIAPCLQRHYPHPYACTLLGAAPWFPQNCNSNTLYPQTLPLTHCLILFKRPIHWLCELFVCPSTTLQSIQISCSIIQPLLYNLMFKGYGFRRSSHSAWQSFRGFH